MNATDRLHVVTGGPGSGKSTLIEALAAAGVATSAEIGRAIIKEELAVGGTALPWLDHRAFADRMIAREIAAHQAALAMGETVVLDRGVPDVIGFLRVSGLAVPAAIDSGARTFRYNPRVFIAPWWAEIFATDAERKQTPEEARATFAVMVETYRAYGYRLVELPRATVAERVAFVCREIERDAMIRRRLVITGKVQGVFYRAWFAEQARGLGIDGWVRNRADGSVEAVVQGPADRVKAIVERAREGSPASRVAEVVVSDDATTERLEGFAKRPTV